MLVINFNIISKNNFIITYIAIVPNFGYNFIFSCTSCLQLSHFDHLLSHTLGDFPIKSAIKPTLPSSFPSSYQRDLPGPNQSRCWRKKWASLRPRDIRLQAVPFQPFKLGHLLPFESEASQTLEGIRRKILNRNINYSPFYHTLGTGWAIWSPHTSRDGPWWRLGLIPWLLVCLHKVIWGNHTGFDIRCHQYVHLNITPKWRGNESIVLVPCYRGISYGTR